MRLLRYLILFVVTVEAVAFAVANRHMVRFVLDPIAGPESLLSFQAPLFLFLFAIGLTWFRESR